MSLWDNISKLQNVGISLIEQTEQYAKEITNGQNPGANGNQNARSTPDQTPGSIRSPVNVGQSQNQLNGIDAEEVQSLRSNLQQKEKELLQLKNEYSKLKLDYKRQQRELSSVSAQAAPSPVASVDSAAVEKLRTENAELSNTLENLKQKAKIKISELQTSLSALSTENTSLKGRVTELEQTVSSKPQPVENDDAEMVQLLQEEKRGLVSRLRELEQSDSANKKKMEKLVEEKKDLLEKLQSTMNDQDILEKVQAENERLRSDLAAANSSSEENNEMAQMLKRENIALKDHLKNSEKNDLIETLKQENSSLKEKFKALESSNNSANESISQDMQNLEARCVKLSEENSTLKAQIESFNNEMQSFGPVQEENAKLKKELADLKNQFESSRTGNDESASLLSSLQEENRQLNQEILRLTNNEKNLVQQIQSMKEEVARLESRITTSENNEEINLKSQKLESELESTRMELSQLQNELRDEREVLKSLREKEDELREENQRLRESNETQLASLKTEWKTSEEKNKELDILLKQKIEQCEMLSQETISLQEELQSAYSQLQEKASLQVDNNVIREKDQRIEALEKQIGDLFKQTSLLRSREQELQKVSSLLAQEKESSSSLSTKYKVLEGKFMEKEQELQKEKTSLASLKKLQEDSEKKNEETKKLIQALQNDSEYLKQSMVSIAEKDAEISRISEELLSLKNILSKKENEENKFKNAEEQNERLQTQLKSLLEKEESLLQKIDSLKEEIEKKDAIEGQMKLELDALRDEQSQNSVIVLKENESLKEELNQLKGQLRNIQNQVNITQEEKEAAIKSKIDLEQDLLTVKEKLEALHQDKKKEAEEKVFKLQELLNQKVSEISALQARLEETGKSSQGSASTDNRISQQEIEKWQTEWKEKLRNLESENSRLRDRVRREQEAKELDSQGMQSRVGSKSGWMDQVVMLPWLETKDEDDIEAGGASENSVSLFNRGAGTTAGRLNSSVATYQVRQIVRNTLRKIDRQT
ncbi:hypothetical protein MP638_004908 [Amoeboaphelidium occidentale]|nr:hypothetical protein MP638_004908 [Amoeboaphelidium occidentale]